MAKKRVIEVFLLSLLTIVLLTIIKTVNVNMQIEAQSYTQNATQEGISTSISKQIYDLVRILEETSVKPIIIEKDTDSYSLTSGRTVLILRSLQSGINKNEIAVVQEKVLNEAKVELGEPSHPIAIGVPWSDTGSMVAYGFAIHDDWVSVSYSKIANNEDEVTGIHQEALEWFKQQLISRHRN